ncbi:MAG: manganese efflux pump MntP family protein [Thaumarchaeota archaeon]|jgi:putative Mn2+ efflux pump MntP|nr:manganese efflux pump MntP family protein [Candidatus Wolframiiraptor allenii]
MIEVVAAIAVGLALDCFSAAFAAGACWERVKTFTPLLLAASFGAFQAGMILLGWTGGNLIEAAVYYDHWIAFVLLAAVGGNMIREGLSGEPMRCEPMTLRLLITLSVATSIDALAVGFSTPFMGLEVVSMSLAAGLASLTLAILGYFMGLKVRSLAGERASIIGGAILVLLGFKILLEHLAGAA